MDEGYKQMIKPANRHALAKYDSRESLKDDKDWGNQVAVDDGQEIKVSTRAVRSL